MKDAVPIIEQAERILREAAKERRQQTRPLVGLDNPDPMPGGAITENHVRTASEPWRDYGDEHGND